MRLLLPLSLLLLTACTEAEPARAPAAPVARASGQAAPIRAVTLDARTRPDEATLDRLAALGATHVAVIPFAFQGAADVPALRTHYDSRWYSEGDAGIRELAARLQARGLRLIIKPHVWLRGAWSAEIGFADETAWKAWEVHYRAWMLHYADLAAAVDADVLVIGTELARAVRARPAFWRRLAADVRARFEGRLTYAANWHDDFEHVGFWDALDFVGVQAYFPLSTAEAPTLAQLKAGWAPHKAALERVHRAAGRPVFFTEIGYRSAHHAAAEPWRWPSDDDDAVRADDALQARLYEAFFEALWHEPWFAGAVVWKWHPEGTPSRRPRTLDFTPQGKPAEQVLARWFTR